MQRITSISRKSLFALVIALLYILPNLASGATSDSSAVESEIPMLDDAWLDSPLDILIQYFQFHYRSFVCDQDYQTQTLEKKSCIEKVLAEVYLNNVEDMSLIVGAGTVSAQAAFMPINMSLPRIGPGSLAKVAGLVLLGSVSTFWQHEENQAYLQDLPARFQVAFSNLGYLDIALLTNPITFQPTLNSKILTVVFENPPPGMIAQWSNISSFTAMYLSKSFLQQELPWMMSVEEVVADERARLTGEIADLTKDADMNEEQLKQALEEALAKQSELDEKFNELEKSAVLHELSGVEYGKIKRAVVEEMNKAQGRVNDLREYLKTPTAQANARAFAGRLARALKKLNEIFP